MRQHDAKLPMPDRKRLWRVLHCDTCKRDTKHIYCMSDALFEMMVYACFECGHEIVQQKASMRRGA